VLHLLRFAVEKTTARLAVHAQVNSFLMHDLVLGGRGNVVAECALELLVVVHQLDVFLKLTLSIRVQFYAKCFTVKRSRIQSQINLFGSGFGFESGPGLLALKMEKTEANLCLF